MKQKHVNGIAAFTSIMGMLLLANPSVAALFDTDSTLPGRDSTVELQLKLAAASSLRLPPLTVEPSLPVVYDAWTAKIVLRLNEAERTCGGLPSEYRADCVQQGLMKASRAESRADYQSSSARLREASRSMKSVVDANLDNSAATISRDGGTFRAVKKDAVGAVNQRAVAILKETETKLLRSGGTAARKVHYQRIAQAVGSIKKILRS